jgi:hypothetical protein
MSKLSMDVKEIREHKEKKGGGGNKESLGYLEAQCILT